MTWWRYYCSFWCIIDAEIQKEETKLFKKLKGQIFGHHAACMAVLEREIESRKKIMHLEKHIMTIQRVWRGYRVRYSLCRS